MMLSSFKYILYLYLLLVPDLHSVSSSDCISRVPSGCLSSLLPSLVQVLEERTGDLQRQLMLAQSELKAAREDAHIHELNKSQLQAQLAGEFLPAAPFICYATYHGFQTYMITHKQDSCTTDVNAIAVPKVSS